MSNTEPSTLPQSGVVKYNDGKIHIAFGWTTRAEATMIKALLLYAKELGTLPNGDAIMVITMGDKPKIQFCMKSMPEKVADFFIGELEKRGI